MPAVPAIPPAWQERSNQGGAEALARYQVKRRADQIEQREVRQKVADVPPVVAASDQASEEMNEESGVPVDADNPPKSPSRHEAFHVTLLERRRCLLKDVSARLHVGSY